MTPIVSNYMREVKWVKFQFLAEFSLCVIGYWLL